MHEDLEADIINNRNRINSLEERAEQLEQRVAELSLVLEANQKRPPEAYQETV